MTVPSAIRERQYDKWARRTAPLQQAADIRAARYGTPGRFTSISEFKAKCNACPKHTYSNTIVGPKCICEHAINGGMSSSKMYWIRDNLSGLLRGGQTMTTPQQYGVDDESFKKHILFASYVGVAIAIAALGISIAAYNHQKKNGAQ